jgi:putative endonuclease
MTKGGCVYILTNKDNSVLYTGVTSILQQRIWQHKTHYFPQLFTSKYNITKLVYYNYFSTIKKAINEEKRIKSGSRNSKIKLIDSMNKEWIDLYETIEF